MHFQYGQAEIDYLKAKDKKLARIIDKIGFIKREINPNLFLAIMQNIISQQISGKAAHTIWMRFINTYADKNGKITPKIISNANIDELTKLGISTRKANFIKEFAESINKNKFDLEKIKNLSDDEAIKELSNLKGIGVWTAEMLLLFSLQRKDIFSYGDLAILKGLKILYGHKEINKDRFLRYKKRFSPYGSIASFYIWEISNKNLKISD